MSLTLQSPRPVPFGLVAVIADFTLETQQKLEELKISAIFYKPFNPAEIKSSAGKIPDSRILIF